MYQGCLTLREGIQYIVTDTGQAVLWCVSRCGASGGGADGHGHGATGTVAG